MTFKIFSGRLILVTALLTLSSAAVRAEGKPATVKGYVFDSACAFVKNLKKPVSPECALACAKAGSPLVILAKISSQRQPSSP